MSKDTVVAPGPRRQLVMVIDLDEGTSGSVSIEHHEPLGDCDLARIIALGEQRFAELLRERLAEATPGGAYAMGQAYAEVRRKS